MMYNSIVEDCGNESAGSTVLSMWETICMHLNIPNKFLIKKEGICNYTLKAHEVFSNLIITL